MKLPLPPTTVLNLNNTDLTSGYRGVTWTQLVHSLNTHNMLIAKYSPHTVEGSMKNISIKSLETKEHYMNSMQTCNSVAFYFMKNSFFDVSRKWILPNMIRAVNR